MGGWKYDALRGRPAWNMLEWNRDAAIATSKFKYGVDVMVNIEVSPDMKEPTRNIMHVSRKF